MKIVYQLWRILARAIVVADTPNILVRAGRNIRFASAATTCPPTGTSREGIRLGCTISVVCERNGRNVGGLELRNPMCKLWGVRGWEFIGSWVVSQVNSYCINGVEVFIRQTLCWRTGKESYPTAEVQLPIWEG